MLYSESLVGLELLKVIPYFTYITIPQLAGLAVVNFMQEPGAIFEYPHNNCDSFL